MSIASPSSPFAALLRRSKFASYDRAIAQVYSSSGGHLHRGNFGFKRPLPIRGREAHITVGAVDSREEQTEWRSADNEARYIKMWDEVGITPTLDDKGPWSTKLGPTSQVEWRMYSDFDNVESDLTNNVHSDAESAIYGPISSATPNIYAMSDREFESYIEKLRQSRPAFASFLKETATRKAEQAAEKAAKAEQELQRGSKSPKRARETKEPQVDSDFTSFWEVSAKSTRDHKIFLASQAYKLYNSADSRAIEQQPQNFGGLHYAKHPPLQSRFLNKPRPGRLVLQPNRLGSNSPWLGVVFAGHNAVAVDNSAVPTGYLDFTKLAQPGEQHSQAGVANFRLTRAVLNNPSQIVGERPQVLRMARLETQVDVEKDADMERSNAHWPGSREYVGHSVSRIKADTILSPRKKPPTMPLGRSRQQPMQAQDVLGTLRGIMEHTEH
ncbi:uncharacterized protein PHACADRAFT_255720 [Phanerochaete carnosa HHB-10118-sp]|uniref:Uncharacterized protein n=1 Tax=Phanerochaete carnosa (strain HHB-10118-sp) TaxID=650164 RepID=K5W8F2_PHACS|nr:uncharacterized protein PHACADRAFT_255720 [Phanerochaete carnosa HHB-10118-sp]EKM55249.1 hypothetical protein PHACADRAFT_255720 [Phanerochaete carnosa HHB-10118-sp]